MTFNAGRRALVGHERHLPVPHLRRVPPPTPLADYGIPDSVDFSGILQEIQKDEAAVLEVYLRSASCTNLADFSSSVSRDLEHFIYEISRTDSYKNLPVKQNQDKSLGTSWRERFNEAFPDDVYCNVVFDPLASDGKLPSGLEKSGSPSLLSVRSGSDREHFNDAAEAILDSQDSPVSDADRKQLKRKFHNKMSARMSRARTAEYERDLTTQVTKLTRENALLEAILKCPDDAKPVKRLKRISSVG